MKKYAIGTYKSPGGESALAIVIDGKLFDLNQISNLSDSSGSDWVNSSLQQLLDEWDRAARWLDDLVERTAIRVEQGAIPEIEGGSSRLQAPLRPRRIFAAASNYAKHADEMGTVLAAKANSNPYVFIKASTAVIGPGETVLIPPETRKADWEVELGAVIGKRARRISVDEALGYVAGYTIVNDVSARDLTRRDDYPFKFDWFQGKSFDTFAPLGPWIVPARFIPDPQNVDLALAVNDEWMQDGNTAEMIFTVAEQIAYLSNLLTLEPGDVIATGTPTGVGASRGIFLKAGDIMEARIAAIGSLTNPVADEVLVIEV